MLWQLHNTAIIVLFSIVGCLILKLIDVEIIFQLPPYNKMVNRLKVILIQCYPRYILFLFLGLWREYHQIIYIVVPFSLSCVLDCS